MADAEPSSGKSEAFSAPATLRFERFLVSTVAVGTGPPFHWLNIRPKPFREQVTAIVAASEACNTENGI